MNKIIFNWIAIQNFISVGDEIVVNFSDYTGMNYVYGENKDSDRKNGSGKCVTGDTTINIEINDEETLKKYKKFINNG